MTYIIWGFLNIGLFVFFLYACFNAAKLLRHKFGIITSLVFVLGLLSFVGSINADKDKVPPSDTNFLPTKYETYHHSSTILEATPISKYILEINYKKHNNSQKVTPSKIYSSRRGFVSGTTWKPMSVIMNPTNLPQRFTYNVVGTVTWHLMGISIYTQPKTYQGIVNLP